MHHSPKPSGIDAGNVLTLIGAVALIIAGLFARSIPLLRDQGSLTRPGLIIGGILIALITLYPMLKKAPPAKRRRDR